MPRLDLLCAKCEHIIENVIVQHKQMEGNGVVKDVECPACGNDIFSVYWGNGNAPAAIVNTSDPEAIFAKCKTLGEYWDRRGVEVGSNANKKASADRIKKIRNKKKNK